MRRKLSAKLEVEPGRNMKTVLIAFIKKQRYRKANFFIAIMILFPEILFSEIFS